MTWDFMFFFNSILLGVGLAMDAFSVSLTNGLNEPKMKKSKMCLIAGVFAFFQFLMPVLGWVCVHTIVEVFGAFEGLIPWIALILLGIKGGDEGDELKKTTLAALAVQGVATSIDALSVGFTIADYDLLMAFVCSVLIAVTTFIICMAGVAIGRKFGTRLSGKASILGGVILIFIGIEIFVTNVFFG